MPDSAFDQLSDDQLVLRGRRGSEAALVELFRRFQPRILGFCRRMTGDRDLAEEVFCATFATFLEQLDRYEPRGKLASYLLRIAHIKLSKEYAARSRLGTSLADAEPDDASLSVPDPGPDEAASQAELVQRTQQALDELPGHLREVVILRIYEDLDFAAIGEITGTGTATARSRMRYALQHLRRHFG